MVRRAKMILMCAEGHQIKDIAAKLGERPNTVILWRDRFIEQGIKGVNDIQRSGKPVTYGKEFRALVLNKLKENPPNGQVRWDGATLAAEINVSDDAVWRLLRKEGIQLSRQRTWCVRAYIITKIKRKDSKLKKRPKVKTLCECPLFARNAQ